MPTIRDHINAQQLQAEGTSEGARKGWETRKGGGGSSSDDRPGHERRGEGGLHVGLKRGTYSVTVPVKVAYKGEGIDYTHEIRVPVRFEPDSEGRVGTVYQPDMKDLEKIAGRELGGFRWPDMREIAQAARAKYRTARRRTED